MANLASHSGLPGSSDADHDEHNQGAQKSILSANILVLGRTGWVTHGKRAYTCKHLECLLKYGSLRFCRFSF